MKKTILFFFLIILFSCKKEVKTFKSDLFKFSLEHPVNWEILTEEESNIIHVYTPEDSLNDGFREMINIVIGSSEGITLDDFFDRNSKIIQNSFDELEEIEKANLIKVNDIDFKTIMYNYTFSGYKLSAKIYVAFHKDKSYIINCSALQDTFENYKIDFEEIVKSIKFN